MVSRRMRMHSGDKRMAMGTRRRRQRQEQIWISHDEVSKGPGHPFYKKVNELLEEAKFDEFAEKECAKFYAENNGRPSVTPGIYFRLLMLGYFEGIASERGTGSRAAEDLARIERTRKNKARNKDWVNPHERDARIAKMKDGSTHLAHKAEHAVDMETGAVLAVTLQAADQGDTATVMETLLQAGENVAELTVTETEKAPEEKPQVHMQGVEEVVTDKGYHSGEVLVDVKDMEVRTYIPEKKQRGQRDWEGQKDQAKARAQQQAVYANRRRVGGSYGKRLLRKRGELVERSFAHCYETGGMRRTHLRAQKNILKRLLIHVGAFNLSLIFRSMLGAGKPRELRNRLALLFQQLFLLLHRLWTPTVRTNSIFPSLTLRSQRNRHYLRYMLSHSKEPASATGC